MLPNYDTNSTFYKNFYYRGSSFDTEYISLGKFVYYSIMNVVGFTFVNIVNLQNVRKNPFLD